MTSVSDIDGALARVEEQLNASVGLLKTILKDVDSELGTIAKLVEGSRSDLPQKVKESRLAIRHEVVRGRRSRELAIGHIGEYRAKLRGGVDQPGQAARPRALMFAGKEMLEETGKATMEGSGEVTRSFVASCRWMTNINDQAPLFTQVSSTQVRNASVDVIESALKSMAAQRLGPLIHRQASKLSAAITVRSIHQPQARTTGLLQGVGRAAAWLIEDEGRSEVAAEIAIGCAKQLALGLAFGGVAVLPIAFEAARPVVKRTLATLATRHGASEAMAPWVASFGAGFSVPGAPGALRAVIEHGIPSSVRSVSPLLSPAVRQVLHLVDKTLVPL